MSRDTSVDRILERSAFLIFVCHQCSKHFYARIPFAAHLVRDHDSREPVLLRFLGVDSDAVSPERLNEACEAVKATSASL